jgi:hypothetical protein
MNTKVENETINNNSKQKKGSKTMKTLALVVQTSKGYFVTLSGCRGNVGNNKIGEDTSGINMCSSIHCPSWKSGKCQIQAFNIRMKKLGKKERAACYAMRDEDLYKGTFLSHLMQEWWWETASRAEKVEAIVQIAEFHMTKYTEFERYFVRASIYGDFRSQEDIAIWSEAAVRLYEKYGVITYTYTCRSDLNFSNHPSCFIIKSSGSVDFTGDGVFELIATDDLLPEGAVECPGSCLGCMFCKVSGLHVCNRNHCKLTEKTFAPWYRRVIAKAREREAALIAKLGIGTVNKSARKAA